MLHEDGPPVRLQLGAFVGATEPVTPVIVPVNVIVCPPALSDWEATTESNTGAFGTITESTTELFVR